MGVRIIESTWPKVDRTAFRSLRATIKFSDQIFNGYGTDFKLEKAIEKSVGELLERIGLFTLSINESKGFAFHYSLEQAVENSRNEAIERELFFNSFNNGRFHSFECITRDNFFRASLPTSSPEPLCYNVDLGSFDGTHAAGVFFIGTATKDAFGLCMGLGADKRKEEAFKKAKTEALVDYMNCLHQNSVERSEMNENDLASLDRSFRRWNVDYGKRFENLFFTNPEKFRIEPTSSAPTSDTWDYTIIQKELNIKGYLARTSFQPQNRRTKIDLLEPI